MYVVHSILLVVALITTFGIIAATLLDTLILYNSSLIEFYFNYTLTYYLLSLFHQSRVDHGRQNGSQCTICVPYNYSICKFKHQIKLQIKGSDILEVLQQVLQR